MILIMVMMIRLMMNGTSDPPPSQIFPTGMWHFRTVSFIAWNPNSHHQFWSSFVMRTNNNWLLGWIFFIFVGLNPDACFTCDLKVMEHCFSKVSLQTWFGFQIALVISNWTWSLQWPVTSDHFCRIQQKLNHGSVSVFIQFATLDKAAQSQWQKHQIVRWNTSSWVATNSVT